MDRDAPSVSPDDDARAAIDLLSKADQGAIPVVDEERKVVGIVSESDLVLADEESDLHLPHYLEIMGGIVFIGSMKGFEKRLEKAFATKVSELMSADPIVVHTYEAADRVAKKIADHHHNHLPVVDEDGRLAGMVTRADALAAGVDDLDGEWGSWSGRSPGSTSVPCAPTANGCGPSWGRRGSARWSRPTATATAPTRSPRRRWPAGPSPSPWRPAAAG